MATVASELFVCSRSQQQHLRHRPVALLWLELLRRGIELAFASCGEPEGTGDGVVHDSLGGHHQLDHSTSPELLLRLANVDQHQIPAPSRSHSTVKYKQKQKKSSQSSRVESSQVKSSQVEKEGEASP